MSDTSPSEHARIQELTGNDPYRTEVLVRLAILTERSDQNVKWQEKRLIWEANHDAKDIQQFSDLNKKIDEKVGAVTSGIASEQKESVISLKQAAIGVLTTLSILGGWAIALWLGMRKP